MGCGLMVNKKSVTFEEVLEEVKKYIHKPENIDLITRAYLFARDQHEGQFRKSGEPYICLLYTSRCV